MGPFNNSVDSNKPTPTNAFVYYTLSVASGGNGTVAIDGGASVSSTSSTVSWGTAVNLSATPASGYVFVDWTVVSGAATIANTSSALTTVTLNGGDASVRANFTAGSTPAISLSSSTLGFAATQGGANPYSQTVIVQNSGGGTLTWSMSSSESWLSVSPSSGNLASGAWSSITVSADISGLSANTYTGTITVSGPLVSI